MSSKSKSASPAPTPTYEKGEGTSNPGAPEPHKNEDKEHTDDTASPKPGSSSATEDPTEKVDTETSGASSSSAAAPAAQQNEWHAVWAPAQGAYYFFNSVTQATTWTNPLAPTEAGDTGAIPQPQPETTAEAPTIESAETGTPGTVPLPSSSNTTASTSKAPPALPAALEGIDPSLAHLLDPSALTNPGAPIPHTFTAKFNSRTGAFSRIDARDPSHLSEFERAKRMSEMYFDVGAWQGEVDERQAQAAQDEAEGVGKKRKKPTKAELERFREQKKQKKISKTAWLRN